MSVTFGRCESLDFICATDLLSMIEGLDGVVAVHVPFGGVKLSAGTVYFDFCKTSTKKLQQEIRELDEKYA